MSVWVSFNQHRTLLTTSEVFFSLKPSANQGKPINLFHRPNNVILFVSMRQSYITLLVVMYGFRLSSLFICVLHQLFCVMAPKKELKKKKTHEFRYSRKIQIIKKTLYNKTAVCISQSWNNYFLNTWSSDNCFHSYEWSTFDLLFSFKEYEDLAYQ